MTWDVESLLSSLGVQHSHVGLPTKVSGVASLKEATNSDLSFCWYEGGKALSLITGSNAGAILCKKSVEERVLSNLAGSETPRATVGEQEKDTTQKHEIRQLFFVDNPRLVFVQLMNKIIKKKATPTVSSLAIISKTAKLGVNCTIGDFAKIGDNCEVGDNVVIGDGVKLVQNCTVGDNCIIQPGVIIGADGFAFERHQSGSLERFPHIKGVKIGSNVEICSNSSVARGSLSDTIIGDGSKLDALVHVAHNVIIGKHCELTAGTIIGGSTTLGDMCWTGLNSTLKDNIRLGNNVIVASGASVIRDVQDQDIVAGVPAKSIKEKVTTSQLFLMSGQQEQKK
ncbi:MAG TPA: UDP-3-O-(3-hydroxymyristoyl)glucosamine N-acyltransferase [Nitrososphaeraceae archaeon]